MGRGQVCRRVSGPGRTEGLTARLAAPAWPRVAPCSPPSRNAARRLRRWPAAILDRGYARRLCAFQAGTEKRLCDRTEKHVVKKGLAAPNREQIMEVNFITRPPKPCLTGDPSYEPNHDGFGWLRRGRLCRLGGVRLYNGLADPQRPVPHRAGVLRPADRKQLRQQDCNLAERRQRGISRRHVRQFRRHGRRLEVEDGEAFCLARTLAGTGEQAPNPYRHVAEQGAERRAVMTLAGQHASASLARATTLAHHGHLRRDHLRLKRGCELLRLREPEPELGYASLFIALEACDLHLRRQARLQFRHQLHSPNQLRHRLILVP